MIRLHALLLGDLHHRHAGASPDDGRQLAAMLGIQMHHDDEGSAGVRRNRRKQALQRGHAAR